MLRKAKTMDEELKKEFKKINREIERLNTNIDELKKGVELNSLGANRIALITIGLSLVLAGGVHLTQQHDWISGGFFMFLGAYLAVFASYWGKPSFPKFVRIARWLPLGLVVGFAIYVVVVVRSVLS